jgi:hypothetical protein
MGFDDLVDYDVLDDLDVLDVLLDATLPFDFIQYSIGNIALGHERELFLLAG